MMFLVYASFASPCKEGQQHFQQLTIAQGHTNVHEHDEVAFSKSQQHQTGPTCLLHEQCSFDSFKTGYLNGRPFHRPKTAYTYLEVRQGLVAALSCRTVQLVVQAAACSELLDNAEVGQDEAGAQEAHDVGMPEGAQHLHLPPERLQLDIVPQACGLHDLHSHIPTLPPSCKIPTNASGCF